MPVKGSALPQAQIYEDMESIPPKGGGIPVHTEYVYSPPPPSPDESTERRRRIFDWKKD